MPNHRFYTHLAIRHDSNIAQKMAQMRKKKCTEILLTVFLSQNLN
uniref:Uncharacterized protein n=1 Tax=Arundo donax TaxID=35708 RepID=A0A0A9I0Q2_ARUDO